MEEQSFEKQYREAQQERRAKRLPVRQSEIESLTGYEIEKKSDYHYRINKVIDIFPIHHRFHDLRINKRGNYKPGTLKEFIDKKLMTDK